MNQYNMCKNLKIMYTYTSINIFNKYYNMLLQGTHSVSVEGLMKN